MRFQSYLNSAVHILQSYHGNEPFHLYIKKYFASNKKYGSGDRKHIASLCYNYFRLGHAFKNILPAERIIAATFLCSDKRSAFLESIRPEWNELVELPVQRKTVIIGEQFNITKIWPFGEVLSKDINADKFNLSFLIQPDLFLRARPGNLKRVTGKLAGASLSYTLVKGDCIALPNASKVDRVIDLDTEAVVQDYNSQRVGEFVQQAVGNRQQEIGNKQMLPFPKGGKAVPRKFVTHNKQPVTGNWQLASLSVWDCCAASGGKSIMAYDIDPTADLTVSDKRESILQNLQQRFLKAGIKKYHSFVADLVEGNRHPDSYREAKGNEQPPPSSPKGEKQSGKGQQPATVPGNFDLIICDAPCTGSGTWSRTPEQLFYFKKESIEKYTGLQKKIVKNIIPFLKPGGQLLYITCSVFAKENEEVVNYITENFKLRLTRMETLKGYEMKADTMFAALLTVPLK